MFIYGLHWVACVTSFFPDKGSNQCPVALEAQSFNHWTNRKVTVSQFNGRKNNAFWGYSLSHHWQSHSNLYFKLACAFSTTSYSSYHQRAASVYVHLKAFLLLPKNIKLAWKVMSIIFFLEQYLAINIVPMFPRCRQHFFY